VAMLSVLHHHQVNASMDILVSHQSTSAFRESILAWYTPSLFPLKTFLLLPRQNLKM
jgi:hypothetical protein